MSQAKLGMRTRNPIGNADSSAVGEVAKVVGNVTIVAAGDLASGLNSTDDGKNGYWAGASRYAHIQVDHTDDVTVYAYNYVFGTWAPLMQLGPAGYVPATFTEDGHYILEISGADRIALVGAGLSTAKIAFNSF